jgi:hypothetical protein
MIECQEESELKPAIERKKERKREIAARMSNIE